MKIEWNKENNTISVGDAVFTGYQPFKNSAVWANRVLSDNNKSIRLNAYSKNSKSQNKEASDALGCSRSVLFKHFNALQLKVFVAPVYDILKKVHFSRRGFNPTVLKKVNEHKDILEEVYNDGLHNLLPIVCATGKSPKELKQELKQVWKSIFKNSLHRNKILARVASKRNRWEYLVNIPTTVLENFGAHHTTTMQYLQYNFKGSWGKPLANETRLFVDTELLAERLGLTVDPKWTPRRVKEEHDRMSKEITARKYSKDVFESVKNISVKSLKNGEYVATLLDNAFAIADEGNSMGHCVAGYADSVRKGDYLVYSVTKNGDRSSTIGIAARQVSYDDIGSPLEAHKKTWYMQQQYGRYNTIVTDEDEKKLAQEIVKMLNEKALTEA